MFVRKSTIAELALELVSSLMYSQMLGEVGLLREALITAWLLADKRPLASVHPKVIEEVVPFTKEHTATVMVTLQNLHLAHSTRIFVFKDAKSARCWYRLFDLNRTEVEVAATLDVNQSICGYLLLHLRV